MFQLFARSSCYSVPSNCCLVRFGYLSVLCWIAQLLNLNVLRCSGRYNAIDEDAGEIDFIWV